MRFHSCTGSTTAPTGALPPQRLASELRDPSIKTHSKSRVSESHLTCGPSPAAHAGTHHQLSLRQADQRVQPSFPRGWQPSAIPQMKHVPHKQDGRRQQSRNWGQEGRSVDKLSYRTLPTLPNINEPLHVWMTPGFEDGCRLPLLLSHTHPSPSYLS